MEKTQKQLIQIKNRISQYIKQNYSAFLLVSSINNYHTFPLLFLILYEFHLVFRFFGGGSRFPSTFSGHA